MRTLHALLSRPTSAVELTRSGDYWIATLADDGIPALDKHGIVDSTAPTANQALQGLEARVANFVWV